MSAAWPRNLQLAPKPKPIQSDRWQSGQNCSLLKNSGGPTLLSHRRMPTCHPHVRQHIRICS